MDAHEALLTEWAQRDHHRDKGFIKDGIIDPRRWASARRKVLLLLKEAYGEREGEANWDLREVIREEWHGPKHHIWHQAAPWCYAAQNTASRDQRFPRDKKKVAEALLSASFISIKKSDGSSASDDQDLQKYMTWDGDLIKRQIELISPEIIICGSTWDLVEELFGERKEVYDGVFTTGQLSIINFWHPGSRFPDGLSYYALVCLLQNGQA